jgi:Vault protein inter-alpha-trypsin domain/von Willebrand factor type A domain
MNTTRILLSLALLGGLATACSQHQSERAGGIKSKGAAAVDEDSDAAHDWGGLGGLQTRNERGETGKLRLENVAVSAKQAGDMAEVTVTHTFLSDAEVAMEGTFRFPMPDGAIVTGLAMMVDGKLMEGELVDNDKARRVYEEIVDAMQDPALMEWEHGQTFKLRVFPIEPKTPKVVTMRYLAPLQRKGAALVYVQGTRASGGGDAIPVLTLDWEGKRIHDLRNVARENNLEVVAHEASYAMREERDDATYTTLRLAPDWAKMNAKALPAPSQWIIVMDTSRSALEERKLQLQSLQVVLEQLPSASRFVVATSDLDTQIAPEGLRAPTQASIADAIRFVERVQPDGATDISGMLRVAGEFAAKTPDAGVLYIGDCEASWGPVDLKTLREGAARDLGGKSLSILMLGAGGDAELARELAAATGGSVLRARDPAQVKAFATRLHQTKRRLSNVELVQSGGSVMLPAGKRSLDEGETLTALIRTPKGAPVPATVVLRSELSGAAQETAFPVHAEATAFVARRFGASWVRELERLGKPKEEVVSASLAFTVMSKHTSFLVLDSEEAYAKYNIERRAQRANVHGVDALGADVANISLDRIQPGDPEIFVDAPEDAEEVLVVLANGETKVASYDPEAKAGRGAWMVRFLVDRDTPEGSYEAQAFILYRDDHREVRTVHYTVDTTEPVLAVSVVAAAGKPGTLEIRVSQKAPKAEVDMRRVEVRTPEGTTLTLHAIRWGEFRALWKPKSKPHGQTLHVVGFDQALNHTILDVTVP